ncbi:hypothetical protein [Euzebya pacifica]|uniref:hypothetical protein n=1 Tax=Euzebya pacifica TaxID=1608957 RepID=UPI000DF7F015|nr:hypothetical protein [Euzebya pacifica]
MSTNAAAEDPLDRLAELVAEYRDGRRRAGWLAEVGRLLDRLPGPFARARADAMDRVAGDVRAGRLPRTADLDAMLDGRSDATARAADSEVYRTVEDDDPDVPAAQETAPASPVPVEVVRFHDEFTITRPGATRQALNGMDWEDVNTVGELRRLLGEDRAGLFWTFVDEDVMDRAGLDEDLHDTDPAVVPDATPLDSGQVWDQAVASNLLGEAPHETPAWEVHQLLPPSIRDLATQSDPSPVNPNVFVTYPLELLDSVVADLRAAGHDVTDVGVWPM